MRRHAFASQSSADSRSEVVAAPVAAAAVPLRQQRARLRDRRARRRPRGACGPAADAAADRDDLDAEIGQLALAARAPRRSSSVSGGVERFFPRPLEPLERPRIAAPRDDVEQRGRQIDPVDLRLAVRPQAIARDPTAGAPSPAQAAGAAGALIRGVGGDALGLEAVDAAIGVVARDLVQPGIDDRRHARNRQRRLGDVGGDDDPPRAVADAATRASCAAASSDPWSGDDSTRFASATRGCRSAIARRISSAPGRKHRTSPGDASSACAAPRRRPTAPARRQISIGCSAPGNVDDRTAVEKRATRGAASIVADITTIRRSSRARHACLASAIARSAWMLRS